MTAERHDPDRRREIQRLLAAAGQPAAPDLRAIEAAVRTRLIAQTVSPPAPGWNLWATAVLLAAALVVGVISAAWRVHAVRGSEGYSREHYLRLIDPLARLDSEDPS